MQRLLAVSRFIDALNRRVGRAMAWCVGASLLISAVHAVLRKGFALGSNAWSEMQWLLFGASFLLGAGYALLADEHGRVEAVAARFGPRTRAALDLAVLLAVVLPLCALMVHLGGAYALRAFAAGERSTMTAGLIVWPARALIPCGFALLGLQAVSEAIKRVDDLLAGRARAAPRACDPPPFLDRPGDAPARAE